MTVQAFLTALLPAVLVSAIVSGPPPGDLCIAKEPCVAVPAGERTVTPAPEPRTFSWTSANGARVVAGVIPAGAARFSTELTGVAHLRLSSGDPARWPAAVTLTVRQDQLSWQIALRAAQVKAGVEIRLAPGAYTLTAASLRRTAGPSTAT